MFEEPITPLQASFSRGEVSPDVYGRVDLQAYSSALRTSRNGFIKTEGVWANRQGTQYVGNAISQSEDGSRLIPFVFDVNQSYVIEISVGFAQVFSNGAVVAATASAAIASVTALNIGGSTNQVIVNTTGAHGLSIGQNITISGVIATGSYLVNGAYAVLSVPSSTAIVVSVTNSLSGAYTSGGIVAGPNLIVSPYLANEIDALRYAQSADKLTIVHPNHPPYELLRLSATSFSFQPGVYNNGPFVPVNTDGTSLVYASAQSGTVTLTSSTPIFQLGHIGGEFYLGQQDVSPIVPWAPVQKISTGGVDPTNPAILTSSNQKNYKCVASMVTGTMNCATGQIAPSHQYGTVWDGNGQANAAIGLDTIGVGWQFTDFGYGCVLITAMIGSPNGAGLYTQCTAVVQAVIKGQPALLPAMVVGGPPTLHGPWTATGDGTTKTFAVISGSTVNDPNQFFVTVAGLYVQPSNYTMTASAIIFLVPPANGAAISVKQSGGLYATSFWAFDAFSGVQGYPATVTYVPDRLIFAGTKGQPVGVFGSQTSQYNNFAVSAPTVNSDAFTVFLNARQLNTICDLIPLQDLIVGTANVIWRLWPGSTGTALGPLSIAATPQAFVGETNSCAALLYGDSMIYTIYGGRRIRDLIYQFQFDKYVGSELTAYSRHLIPLGSYVSRMQYAPDPWGQVFVQVEPTNSLLTCTYVRDQQMIAWSRWDTQGGFEDVCVVPENNSYAAYVIVSRKINGSAVRYVERFSQWEWQTIYDYKFMDCSLTYDGRNTSATTMALSGGSTWLSGDTGTLSASGASGWAGFSNTDSTLGNQIQLFDASGKLVRVTIIGMVSSTTSCSVRFVDPVPPTLQNTPTLTWSFARIQFSGASALAGMSVACLIDSNAYAGTDGVPILQVAANGTFTLPNPGGVVTVGLAYNADFETLHLNQPGIQTIRERAKSMPGIYLDVHATRGLLTGTDFDHMTAIKERQFETYLQPTDLQEGIINNRIESEFDSECHLCVRQPWPLPATIRMVIPSVNVGEPVG